MSSQRWLVGQDDSLDNFFISAPSFNNKRTGSLKRRVSSSTEEKRAKVSRQTTIVLPKDGSKATILQSKGKAREAFDDVTTSLQNSPRRRSAKNTRHMKQSISRTSPTRRKTNVDTRLVEDSLSEDDEYDTPMRLRKQTPSRMKGILPTPPASSAAGSGRTHVNGRDSSPISTLPLARQKNNEMLLMAKTPFTFTCASSNHSYPTPHSVTVPRLSFALPSTEKLPAPSLDLDSDSSLTSLSSDSASPSAMQADFDEEVEEQVADIEGGHKEPQKNKPKPFAIVPSSQTQYIHYSPTKKNKPGRSIEFPDVRFKQPSLQMVPSSQSQLSQPLIPTSGPQSVRLSPRKTRKPTPLFTHDLSPSSPSKDGRGKQQQSAALNFVVPTSQEDEMEISLLNGAAPHLSQLVGGTIASKEELSIASESQSQRSGRYLGKDRSQMRAEHIEPLSRMATVDYGGEEKETSSGPLQSQSTQVRAFNAMLDDLDRLVEETRMNTTTASQVLSRRLVKASSPVRSRHEYEDERSANRRSNLTMQSSITEPESSQWHEDPFAPTNEAYMKHRGLKPHVDESSQNSNTRNSGSSLEKRNEKDTQASYTQSTATQVDSGDEDPFPMLPPASTAPTSTAPTSTAESTADRSEVDNLLLSTQESAFGCHQRSPVRPQHTTSSRTPQRVQSQSHSETESESENEPMPDIGSFDDQFDMRLLTPRGVRRAVIGGRGTSRFRRRDDRSFMLANGVSQGDSEPESIPSAVRDFLNMFSSQTQSQTQSQSQEG